MSEELSDCISACLQVDPARRPGTAHDLVLALAGEEPLEKAQRAGRMPSADLLAASVVWQPAPWLLNLLVAAGLGTLLLIWLLADAALFLPRCGLVKSPVALAEIAQQILLEQGHMQPIDPVQTGVQLDTDCLQYVRAHSHAADAWHKVATGEIPAVSFWYRVQDVQLPRPGLLPARESEASRPLQPGGALVRLDGRGKLLSLQLTSRKLGDPSPNSSVAWPQLFALAGLPWPAFREVETDQSPPVFADTVHRWQGSYSADPMQDVSVMAASLGGHVVYFDVVQPWDARQIHDAAAQPNKQSSRFATVQAFLYLSAFVLAAVLAWRHVMHGHADWQGAWRMTACVLVLGALNWLCGSRHNFVLADEMAAAFDWLNAIVFAGAIAGIAYLAVEPSARRWWPWSVITLRRLLAGRFRDRRIWSDGLLGIVAGLFAVLLRQLCTLANGFVGIPVSGLNDFDPSQNLLDHFGLRYKLAVLITALLLAVLESLLVLSLLVMLRRWTKSTLFAAVLLVGMLAALAIFGRGIVSPIDWLARTLLLAIAAGLLLRFGLLPTITALTIFYALNNAPLTLDWTRWYASTGLVVVAAIAAALITSWRLSRTSDGHSP